MSLTARKDRRHLWWKQHKKLVEGKEDGAEEVKRDDKKYSHKEKSKSIKKDQPTTVTTPIDNDNKKTRFILFVGNLPFDLQKDDIIHHFRCTGGVIDFRLMTKKDGGSSKGCGFLELDSFTSYEKALNLHHSLIGKRKINVEVTCGGGGTGDKRSEKLNEKKKKFRQRRGKKSKSIKENNDNANNEEKQQSLIQDKVKTKTAEEKLPCKRAEDMTDTTEVKKVTKKRKNTAEDADCLTEKPIKKSLKQSDSMNSMIKVLGLETLVEERKTEKEEMKAKARKDAEDYTSNEQTKEMIVSAKQEEDKDVKANEKTKMKKAKKRKMSD